MWGWLHGVHKYCLISERILLKLQSFCSSEVGWESWHCKFWELERTWQVGADLRSAVVGEQRPWKEVSLLLVKQSFTWSCFWQGRNEGGTRSELNESWNLLLSLTIGFRLGEKCTRKSSFRIPQVIFIQFPSSQSSLDEALCTYLKRDKVLMTKYSLRGVENCGVLWFSLRTFISLIHTSPPSQYKMPKYKLLKGGVPSMSSLFSLLCLRCSVSCHEYFFKHFCKSLAKPNWWYKLGSKISNAGYWMVINGTSQNVDCEGSDQHVHLHPSLLKTWANHTLILG